MSTTDQSRAYLRIIMIIATFGGLLFGYDTGVVNGALPYMAQPDQLNLTPLHEGMVASGLLLGAAFGSVIGGKLSDFQGRRNNIICLAVLFFFATLGCSMAPNFYVMVVARFLLGLAVGGASVTVPAYLAEVSPSERRGRMVTQNELMIVTGQFMAFVINAIIAVVMSDNPHVWRYMLSVAAIPAVILFFGMMRLPESPRWLAAHGRISDSLNVLKKIRKDETSAIAELNMITDTIESERSMHQVGFKEIFMTPWIRRIVLIGMGIATFTQLTGVNSIMYYGTQILNKSGFGMQAALIANTLNGLTAVLGVCLGIHLMTKLHRRTMLLIGLSGTTVAMFLITMSANFLAETAAFPYIILCLIILFLAFMQSCIGPMLWLLLAEIIPLKVRGVGMGLCVLFHWMTNFVVGLTFPVLLSVLGLKFTFGIFVCIGFVGLTFVKLYVPETTGKTLEEIEQGFRNYDRKKVQSAGTSIAIQVPSGQAH